MNRNLVIKAIDASISSISRFLYVREEKLCDELPNILVTESSHGFNYEVFIIRFPSAPSHPLCLKYSVNPEKHQGLMTEATVLTLLRIHGIACPTLIESWCADMEAWILMEAVQGIPTSRLLVDVDDSRLIRNLIQAHEAVLLEYLEHLESSLAKKLHEHVDFEMKLHLALGKHTPHMQMRDVSGLLNRHLNSPIAMASRTLVTDRSASNILKDGGHFTLIDFSTVRIGTKFDNWIQFIDDPHARFLLPKRELRRLYLNDGNLSREDEQLFLVAAVYTNLLQGIYTYGIDDKLGSEYFDRTNLSYQELTGEKNMLMAI